MLNVKKQKKLIVLAAASAAGVLFFSHKAHAQLTLSGSSYTQNFDNIGSGLPTGWTASTGATAATVGTTATLISAATQWSDTGGGFKNMAAADSGLVSTATSTTQAAAADRAFGVRTVTATDVGAAFNLQLSNTANLSNFTLQVSLQMLSVQPRTQTWSLQYGIGAAPTTFTTLTTYSDPGVFGSTTVSFSGSTLSAIENLSGPVWIRFVALAATGGSGNRDSVGIDDFSLSYTNSGGGPKDLTWTGAINTNWDTATINFVDSVAAASAFSNADTVTFGNTGVGTVNIVPATVGPASLAFTNTTGTYTLTGGAVAGSTGLDKIGAGSLVLMNTNTFTGATNVTGGSLTLGVNNALASNGSLVVNGATASVDIGSTLQTLGGVTLTAGQIIGSGTITGTNYSAAAGTISASLAGVSTAFTKTGAGSVVLNGTNSYGGLTSLSGGTLLLNSAGALPTGGAVAINGATAIFDVGSQAVTTGGVVLTAGQISGSGTINASSTSAVNGTIGGASLIGSGAFTKTGTGVVTINGTHAYNGATSILTGGTLVVNGSLTNSAVTVDGTLRTGTTATFGSTVAVNGGATLNAGGTAASGTITSGAMSFASNSVLAFDLGTAATDLINLGANTLTVSNTSTINYSGSGIIAGNSYTLFTAGGFSGANFTTGTKPGGLGAATYNFDGSAYTVTFATAPKGLGTNPFSFAAAGARYYQDFNTLTTSGAGLLSSLPAGWSVVETTGDNSTYTAGAGSNVGDTYSFGSGASSERALGSLRSGSSISVMGFNLKNDTGSAITEINMSYVGEQWRLGTADRANGPDKLDFQYSVTASSVAEEGTGIWIDFDALDFTAPIASGTVGALNGNDSANQTPISAIISGLNVAPGEGIWFRWVDYNADSSDDGLAIDNLTFVPEPASLSLLALGGMGLMRRRRRSLVTA